jgi:hypothetical protein
MGAGWTTASTLPALAASGFSKTDFEGFVNFADGSAQYKFIPQNTSLMEIMEVQQDLMGHTLVCYYKLVNPNAGLPAPKSCRLLLF